MSDEFIKVENLRRLDVKPGDKYVLMIDGIIHPEVAARLREGWMRFIGGDIPLLILEKGMELGVMRPSDVESTQ